MHAAADRGDVRIVSYRIVSYRTCSSRVSLSASVGASSRFNAAFSSSSRSAWRRRYCRKGDSRLYLAKKCSKTFGAMGAGRVQPRNRNQNANRAKQRRDARGS